MAFGAIVLSYTNVMVLGAYFVFSIYFLIISSFAVGFIRWRKSAAKANYRNKKHTKISVVIAARNEEEYLPRVLSDLAKQHYPPDKYEIILVDDHSEVEISSFIDVKKFKPVHLTVLSLPEGKMGKKASLLYGAKNSNADLLAFTDADCRISENWLSALNAEYINSRPDLIIGVVDYLPERGVLHALFRLDFLSLVCSGIGAAAIGRPVFCNGANLAVNSVVYSKLASGLRTDTPSGDDVFLLHAVKREKLKINTLNSKDALVYTKGPDSASEFFLQRFRWASKSKYYQDNDTIILGFVVLIANLCFLVGVILLLFSGFNFFFLFALFIKPTADLILLISGLSFFKRIHQMYLFPLAAILHPISMLFSLLAFFPNTLSWKDRKF